MTSEFIDRTNNCISPFARSITSNLLKYYMPLKKDQFLKFRLLFEVRKNQASERDKPLFYTFNSLYRSAN